MEDMVYMERLDKKEKYTIPLTKTLKEELQKTFEWNTESDSFVNVQVYTYFIRRGVSKVLGLNKQNLDECIEISEMKNNIFNWLHSYNFGPHSDYIFFIRKKIRHIINHFYKEIKYRKKIYYRVVCDYGIRKNQFFEILEKLTFNNEEMNINYINLYKLY